MESSSKQPRNPRSMFWRLCLRSLQVKRPQAALGICSLIVGAAVCSLLLNLYGGVNRKMTESFRAFGANVTLVPRPGQSQPNGLPGALPGPMDNLSGGQLEAVRRVIPDAQLVSSLYVVARLTPAEPDPRLPDGVNVLAVGTDVAALLRMNPNWRVKSASGGFGPRDCVVGARLAAEMNFHPGGRLLLRNVSSNPATGEAAGESFRIAAVVSTGDAADDQVIAPLAALQQLAQLPGKVSVVDARIPGAAPEIESAVRRLAKILPGVEVRPVRQIVYSEGRVLGTVRRLMLVLTVLILVIIALCVAATMTAIVLERRKDVAVMKALGATDRTVMEIFLCEGALLGLAGGAGGFLIGALCARAVALRLFDAAIPPNWWMLPVVCACTTILALLATMFPVRLVRGIQPAVALKGA